nr:hypothetical protein [Tanacetum cinerariifolium]
MCTYQKNIEGYKLKDLKLEEFDYIQEMFGKAFKRVNTFKDFRTELVEGKEKRAGTKLIQEITKKQKVEDDKEIVELKQFMEIILDEEEVAIDAIHLAVKKDYRYLGKYCKPTRTPWYIKREMERDMENMTLNEYLMYEGRNVYLMRNCTSKKRGACSKVAPVRSRNLVSSNSDEEDKESMEHEEVPNRCDDEKDGDCWELNARSIPTSSAVFPLLVMCFHCQKKFPLLEESSHCQKKFPLKALRKPSVRYAELYRKPSKKSTVRGNQQNWNNLKSQQLGVKIGRSSPKNNNTHKSMPPRPSTHKPYRPSQRPVGTNMNGARPNRTTFNKQAHSYENRPFQRTSAVRPQYRAPWVPTVNMNFPL